MFNPKGSFIRRIIPVLPWFSLGWALWSGLSIARDFAHGWRLLVFAVGMFGALGLIRFSIRKERVEWLVLALAQMQVQYVLMFSIPFLYWAKTWWLFALVICTAVSTLWDPWWQRLARFPNYVAFVRALCALLASSFLVSIFFPKASRSVEYISLSVAVISAVPWRELFVLHLKTIGLVRFAALTVPAIFWVVCLVFTVFGYRTVPLLSVWVEPSARFGFDVDNRSLVRPVTGNVVRTELQDGFAQGSKLCCWTPIVAPRHLREKVVHRWFVDGRLVDTIFLGDMNGLDELRAFRTYSCKSALDNVSVLSSIRCEVALEDGPIIGFVQSEVY